MSAPRCSYAEVLRQAEAHLRELAGDVLDLDEVRAARRRRAATRSRLRRGGPFIPGPGADGEPVPVDVEEDAA